MLLQDLDYLVLPMVECDKEHMHVFKRRSLLLQLALQNAVIHQVNPRHAADNICRLVNIVVPVMPSNTSCGVHDGGSHDGINVIQGGVATSILVQCVRLVLRAARVALLGLRLSDLLAT